MMRAMATVSSGLGAFWQFDVPDLDGLAQFEGLDVDLDLLGNAVGFTEIVISYID